MRLDSDPALRQKAHQYFMARKTTLLPSPLQTKAVGYVDDVIAARLAGIRQGDGPFGTGSFANTEADGEIDPRCNERPTRRSAVSFGRSVAYVGPIYPVVVALSKMTKTQILNELAITNTCPLILTGVRCEDNNFINEIVQQAAFMPRRLVLTGEAEVVIRPPMKRIVTNLWYVDAPILMGLPLESMGALILRRFARGERLDYDIVKGNVA
ncbi:hypothetical protein Q3G72_031359 [Acer saccharum]|nr:hypothetical protein Q3G72_031359 [Acer saccharum]